MNELPFAPDDVLLRASDVQAWKDDRERLVAQRDGVQAKIDEINRKLELVALLTGKKPVPAIYDDKISLPGVIMDILGNNEKPLSKKQIRRHVEEIEFWRKKLETNVNYFYTVMSRLERRGMVSKVGKLYRAMD